jgi:hypothetical protein
MTLLITILFKKSEESDKRTENKRATVVWELPALNDIESLWGIVKGRLEKNRMFSQ